MDSCGPGNSPCKRTVSGSNPLTGSTFIPAKRMLTCGDLGGLLAPDGHAWEVAYNPGFVLLEHGSVVVGEAHRTSQ